MQAVIQTMIAEMRRDGKTKLIVDLQGNGGGVILNGFDAFRQLFPQTQDVMFARQRMQPEYVALA
jgi:C-terminal processing protease CtpA/Prc